jgi:hypothetical protein
MGDRSAIGPLIDALITVHKFKIVTSNSGGPGSTTTTFGKGPGMGGGGMTMGQGPTYFKRDMQNQAVLDTLAVLTGVNYGFDKRAWKNWYASQRQKAPSGAARGKS